MQNSKLYDIVSATLIDKWRKQIENSSLGYGKKLEDTEKTLRSTLNDFQNKMLGSYNLLFRDYTDEIISELCSRIFNFGIKTGMELQTAFDNDLI